LNAWKILSGFNGLKVLRIELRDCYRNRSYQHPYWAQYPQEVAKLAPLLNDICCIKQVKTFEIWVPWKAADLGSVMMEDTPFTLLGEDGVIWERRRK
jgi:hypothetical protein